MTRSRRRGRAQRKGGKLPPHVMVYFVMALALFAEEDYEEVWARLAETLADWGGWEESWDRVPTSGGITQARQRLGAEPVEEMFTQVAGPVATDTRGAFLGPWRKMSIDGLEWDVPDTAANAAAFGYPGPGRTAPAAFPKARVVTIASARRTRRCWPRSARHAAEGQRRAVPGPRPVPAAGGGLAADRRPELL